MNNKAIDVFSFFYYLFNALMNTSSGNSNNFLNFEVLLSINDT